MRIAINCRAFLKKNFTGIGRYAYNLVDSLSKIDKDNEYLLYVQKGLLDFKRKSPKPVSANFKVKVDWFNKGISSTLGPVDIYHSPSPDVIEDIPSKIIVTVHDLIYKAFPEGHTEETLELTDKQIRSFISRAAKIICPSQSTMNDLFKYFKIERDKVCVVPQGVDKSVFYRISEEEKRKAQGVLKEKGMDKPFLLSVGTIEPRKNLKGVFDAFADLKKRKVFDGILVVAGMNGWKDNGLLEYIEHLGITEDIFFLGFVSNDELRYLYNLAEVFVFPSFYEGFGYPILEAFCCNVPVITSNVSACAEVAQDAAVTVDPHKPEEISRAIEGVLLSKMIRKELTQKGLEIVENYSHEKTAEQTLKVYIEVYNR